MRDMGWCHDNDDYIYDSNYYREGKRNRFRYTEDVLNGTSWVTASGDVFELKEMEKDHLRNVLHFVYKNKEKYWLGCRDARFIEQFDNGEDFFQRVIRKSTFWKEAMRLLTSEDIQGFNFEIDRR